MDIQPFANTDYTIDYPLFKQFFRFHGREHVRASLLGHIAPPLGLALSLATGIAFGFDWLTLGLAVISGVLLIAKVYTFFVTPGNLYRRAETLYTAPHSVQLYDASFRSEVQGNVQTINYAMLWRAYETSDMFLLYITETQVTLLPKRALPEQACLRLRAVLQRQLNKKYILRAS